MITVHNKILIKILKTVAGEAGSAFLILTAFTRWHYFSYFAVLRCKRERNNEMLTDGRTADGHTN